MCAHLDRLHHLLSIGGVPREREQLGAVGPEGPEEESRQRVSLGLVEVQALVSTGWERGEGGGKRRRECEEGM
jgi:hypothetical protein